MDSGHVGVMTVSSVCGRLPEIIVIRIIFGQIACCVGV